MIKQAISLSLLTGRPLSTSFYGRFLLLPILVSLCLFAAVELGSRYVRVQSQTRSADQRPRTRPIPGRETGGSLHVTGTDSAQVKPPGIKPRIELNGRTVGLESVFPPGSKISLYLESRNGGYLTVVALSGGNPKPLVQRSAKIGEELKAPDYTINSQATSVEIIVFHSNRSSDLPDPNNRDDVNQALRKWAQNTTKSDRGYYVSINNRDEPLAFKIKLRCK